MLTSFPHILTSKLTQKAGLAPNRQAVQTITQPAIQFAGAKKDEVVSDAVIKLREQLRTLTGDELYTALNKIVANRVDKWPEPTELNLIKRLADQATGEDPEFTGQQASNVMLGDKKYRFEKWSGPQPERSYYNVIELSPKGEKVSTIFMAGDGVRHVELSHVQLELGNAGLAPYDRKNPVALESYRLAVKARAVCEALDKAGVFDKEVKTDVLKDVLDGLDDI